MTNMYKVDISANFTEDFPSWSFTRFKTKDELRDCITKMQIQIEEQEEKIKEMKNTIVTFSRANVKLETRNIHLRSDIHDACVRRDEAIGKRLDIEHDVKVYTSDAEYLERQLIIENNKLQSKILHLSAENAHLKAIIAELRQTHGPEENSDNPAENTRSGRHPVEISSNPGENHPSLS